MNNSNTTLERINQNRKQQITFLVKNAAGTPIGVIWTFKTTRTCRDSWHAQRGIGMAGTFGGNHATKAEAIAAVANSRK
jgi:hypothetical protein